MKKQYKIYTFNVKHLIERMLLAIHLDIQPIIFKYIDNDTLDRMKDDYPFEVYNYSDYELSIGNIEYGLTMMNKYKKIKTVIRPNNPYKIFQNKKQILTI